MSRNSVLSFDNYVKKVRSLKGRKLLAKSNNYWVLNALFNGKKLNNNPKYAPWNAVEEKEIMDVKSRISDLVNKYNIKIQSDYIDGGNAKEYWLELD